MKLKRILAGVLACTMVASSMAVTNAFAEEDAPIANPVDERMPGDFNGDGKVNSMDSYFLLQYSVASANDKATMLANRDLTEASIDVNGDGKVNILDLTNVAKTAMKSSKPEETTATVTETTETATETVSETATDTETETATETVSETATDTETETATETVSETATDTETETATETVSETATDTETETATETVSETTTETATETTTEETTTYSYAQVETLQSELVDQANAFEETGVYSEYKETVYSDEKVTSAAAAALAAIETAKGENATSDDCKAAIDAIDAAKTAVNVALTSAVDADMTATLVAAEKELANDEYTDATWEVLNTAVKAAKALDAEATTLEKVAAIKDIDAAIAGLKTAAGEKAEAKAALDELIKTANTLLEKKDDYTSDTVNALSSALIKANRVANSSTATTEDYLTKVEDLQTAIDGLVLNTEALNSASNALLDDMAVAEKYITDENASLKSAYDAALNLYTRAGILKDGISIEDIADANAELLTAFKGVYTLKTSDDVAAKSPFTAMSYGEDTYIKNALNAGEIVDSDIKSFTISADDMKKLYNEADEDGNITKNDKYAEALYGILKTQYTDVKSVAGYEAFVTEINALVKAADADIQADYIALFDEVKDIADSEKAAKDEDKIYVAATINALDSALENGTQAYVDANVAKESGKQLSVDKINGVYACYVEIKTAYDTLVKNDVMEVLNDAAALTKIVAPTIGNLRIAGVGAVDAALLSDKATDANANLTKAITDAKIYKTSTEETTVNYDVIAKMSADDIKVITDAADAANTALKACYDAELDAVVAKLTAAKTAADYTSLTGINYDDVINAINDARENITTYDDARDLYDAIVHITDKQSLIIEFDIKNIQFTLNGNDVTSTITGSKSSYDKMIVTVWDNATKDTDATASMTLTFRKSQIATVNSATAVDIYVGDVSFTDSDGYTLTDYAKVSIINNPSVEKVIFGDRALELNGKATTGNVDVSAGTEQNIVVTLADGYEFQAGDEIMIGDTVYTAKVNDTSKKLEFVNEADESDTVTGTLLANDTVEFNNVSLKSKDTTVSTILSDAKVAVVGATAKYSIDGTTGTATVTDTTKVGRGSELTLTLTVDGAVEADDLLTIGGKTYTATAAEGTGVEFKNMDATVVATATGKTITISNFTVKNNTIIKFTKTVPGKFATTDSKLALGDADGATLSFASGNNSTVSKGDTITLSTGAGSTTTYTYTTTKMVAGANEFTVDAETGVITFNGLSTLTKNTTYTATFEAKNVAYFKVANTLIEIDNSTSSPALSYLGKDTANDFTGIKSNATIKIGGKTYTYAATSGDMQDPDEGTAYYFTLNAKGETIDFYSCAKGDSATLLDTYPIDTTTNDVEIEFTEAVDKAD